ncbi:hypothetical protein EDB85DRAFT_1154589 [Lactarius pseudohatsudake]|nr:hypothetical protein EDB85DRAFT_1154589 [Lactarius pseudohatsudake]
MVRPTRRDMAASCLGRPVQNGMVTKQGDPPPTSHSRPDSYLVQILTISCVPALRHMVLAWARLELKRPAFISSSRPPRTYKDPHCPHTSPPSPSPALQSHPHPSLYAFLRPSDPLRDHVIQQGVQRPIPVHGQAPDWPVPRRRRHRRLASARSQAVTARCSSKPLAYPLLGIVLSAPTSPDTTIHGTPCFLSLSTPTLLPTPSTPPIALHSALIHALYELKKKLLFPGLALIAREGAGATGWHWSFITRTAALLGYHSCTVD